MNAEETVLEVSESRAILLETHKRRNMLLHFTIFSTVSVGGWMQSDPSFLVERFCPDVNEWRSTAHVFNNRAGVAVAALEGRIYTAGGENNAQRYSSVER